MGRKPRHIVLSTLDESTLVTAHQKGDYQGRRAVRAQILLGNHQGKRISSLQAEFGLSQPTVSRVLSLYESSGLESALTDAPRIGAPVKVTAKVEARVTAIVCSEAPAGRVRWTLELLENEMFRLSEESDMPDISRESIRTILKKANSNLGRYGNGALGQ